MAKHFTAMLVWRDKMMVSQNTMAATSAISILILNALMQGSISTYQIKEAIEEGDKYLRHSHPLQLVDNFFDGYLQYNICENRCSDHAYCCSKCCLFFRPSWTTQKFLFLRKILYPFNPYHFLVLKRVLSSKMRDFLMVICNVTWKSLLRSRLLLLQMLLKIYFLVN